jgi:hypothetical protein
MRRITPGLLAFIACFALASPGFDAEPEPQGGEGGQCALSQPSRLDAEVESFVAELRRQRAGQEPSRDVIVLNNRGYNYGPGPGIQLDMIRAEALRPRH